MRGSDVREGMLGGRIVATGLDRARDESRGGGKVGSMTVPGMAASLHHVGCARTTESSHSLS